MAPGVFPDTNRQGNFRKFGLITTLLLLWSVLGRVELVFAQDDELEEIIVTARKLGAENVQDILSAISAFGSETLQDMDALILNLAKYRLQAKSLKKQAINRPKMHKSLFLCAIKPELILYNGGTDHYAFGL